ncbi:hypothetical protein D5086_024822 [Populus alba]|uniref:Uncharacterized protein n=1 Tax=Populus alba TaxID=43335 RepID=A0ACC4B853_POPAL
MNRLIHTPTAKFRRFRRHHQHATSTTDPNPLQILWRYQILDPDSEIVMYWNHVFLLTSIIALFIDPLYFYLPYVGPQNRDRITIHSDYIYVCLSIDKQLSVLITYFRQFYCWKSECTKENKAGIVGCIHSYLDCNSLGNPERQYWRNVTDVPANCDARNSTLTFKYGIFADAFINDVASSRFIEKFLYCLWWGLRNLSSYGQTLETSTFLGENVFCILICIIGLVLSAQLIGNMQTNLQSMTVRVEEWRIKRRDTEEWMRHRQLPPDLQERVRRFVQHKWLATRGVHEESILHSLPLDLRREIQRHLSLALVRRVPFFSQMDDQLLDAICERLVSSLSTEGTYIVREGDPVNEMLFVIRGQLESSTTNGGRSGFFNSITLRPGDFCGEELLTWALMPISSANLPSSTRTVKALSEVEAFALEAKDLKFFAHQFKRLQSKKLQHAFRWRLRGVELWDVIDDNADNVYHLVATTLASRFSADTKTEIHQKSVSGDSATEFRKPENYKPNSSDSLFRMMDFPPVSTKHIFAFSNSIRNFQPQ